MTLRYATITDAEKLCQFARQTFYDSYAWYNDEQDMAAYLSNNFTIKQIAQDIANAQTRFIIVLDNNNLCGYVKLAWNNRPDIINNNEKQLEIARLYADKQFIGKGVGKLLMEASIAFAEKENAAIIWLDVWKENRRAIQFYTKWGFEIVSDWTFVLGNDRQEDYIMVKRL